MPLNLRESGPSLTEELIDGTEEVLEVRLPAPYRAFLMRHNGGRPTPNRLTLGDHGACDIVDFYRLEHPHNNLVARAEMLWDRDTVPRGLLPVALLSRADTYLFLAVEGIDRDSGAGDLVGAVYAWLTDNPPQGTTVWHDLIHIADDFEQLLGLIHAGSESADLPAAADSPDSPDSPAAAESADSPAPAESADSSDLSDLSDLPDLLEPPGDAPLS